MPHKCSVYGVLPKVKHLKNVKLYLDLFKSAPAIWILSRLPQQHIVFVAQYIENSPDHCYEHFPRGYEYYSVNYEFSWMDEYILIQI